MKRGFSYVSFIITIVCLAYVSCKKQSCETCRQANQPPVAVAGPDQLVSLPTDSVLLDGRISNDPDGSINSYLWTKISGPSFFTIGNSSASTTTVKNLIAGIYQFELKVTDNKGLLSRDTTTVTVTISPATSSSCRVENLTWTTANNGMMALINPGAVAGTLDCAGYGAEFLIPSHYNVWIQFEGSSNWLRLEFISRDLINSTAQNIFLSSVIYNEPTGNDGPVSVPIVYAKPGSGIDFTKRVLVKNAL